MFKHTKKEDLRLIALEINLTVDERSTFLEISNLIKNSKEYTEDRQAVKDIAETIIEERKSEELS